MARGSLVYALAALGLLLFAACGGSSNEGSTTTSTPTIEAPSATATLTEAAPTSDALTAPKTVACQADQLVATTGRQGAAGHTLGAITFTNTSATECTLKGQPDITIEDGAGVNLAVLHTAASFAPELAGDPSVAVNVTPGGMARVNFDWVGACVGAPLTSPEIVTVVLPGGAGTVEADRQNVSGTCLGPAQTSSIGIGAFIPAP